MTLHDETVSGADGVKLHVTRAGAGPPVILLHGFPEDSRTWSRQIATLVEAGFSVWAPDLRGYFRSEKPAGSSNYHLRKLVADVAAIIRATGAPRAHVVGHDWGGVIAWAFAASHPELLDRLVILNAPHRKLYRRKLWRPAQFFRSWYVLFFQLPWLPEWFLSARGFDVIKNLFRLTPAQPGAYSEEEIEAYVRALREPGALTAAVNYYRANLRSNALDSTTPAVITAETLVIWGERDIALSRLLLDGLDEVAPRVRVHRIPRAGHWVHREATEEVNGVLLRFLQAAM
jgi:pimeloyl-ACP methyl ester carboxylesterase